MVVYNDVESQEKIKIYDKGVDKPPYTETFGEFQCNYRYGNVLIRISVCEPLRKNASTSWIVLTKAVGTNRR